MASSVLSIVDRSTHMASSVIRVRHAIAQAVLGGHAQNIAETTGTIMLHPHQHDAVHRLRAALEEFGGALLADEPGLGKTYVALAIARAYEQVIVTAPAALRDMWRMAAERMEVRNVFVSLETLSRRDPVIAAPAHSTAKAATNAEAVRHPATLIIVDEAHHAHHPRTARYGRLARLCLGAHVLLLSATPVRNRLREWYGLLALFLGPRVHTLSDAARARCVVRRTAPDRMLPRIIDPTWQRAPRTLDISRDLRGLPPALPALDGGDAPALLAMTLARCWASSLMALDAALRRRLQRGAALEAALEAGRFPTRAELRSWVLGDDAVQLAFPSLMAAAHTGTDTWRSTLDTHLQAVRTLRARIAPFLTRDIAARAKQLLAWHVRHGTDTPLIAFTSYTATAESLFRVLHDTPGVVLLTGRGAHSAGGHRPRADVLTALAGHQARHANADRMTLIIATDVLSEGVNLQGASIVVHLDSPWTPAALEQRVGRVARIGSSHERVFVYGVQAPRGAERLLALERCLVRKRSAQQDASRGAEEMERLRNAVRAWCQPGRNDAPCTPGIANVAQTTQVASVHVQGDQSGCIAVVRYEGVTRVIGAVPHRLRYRITDRPHDILALVTAATMREMPLPQPIYAAIMAAVRGWLVTRTAKKTAGMEEGNAPARRHFLRRLHRIWAQLSPHRRAVMGSRIAGIQTIAMGHHGAGAESQFAALASLEMPDVDRWLDHCEHVFSAMRMSPKSVDGDCSSTANEPAIVALLILVAGTNRVTHCSS